MTLCPRAMSKPQNLFVGHPFACFLGSTLGFHSTPSRRETVDSAGNSFVYTDVGYMRDGDWTATGVAWQKGVCILQFNRSCPSDKPKVGLPCLSGHGDIRAIGEKKACPAVLAMLLQTVTRYHTIAEMLCIIKMFSSGRSLRIGYSSCYRWSILRMYSRKWRNVGAGARHGPLHKLSRAFSCQGVAKLAKIVLYLLHGGG